MTCGYRTFNGSDLDNHFWSNYSNAGALGLRQADGWDLGNKYTAVTNLGYSLGYRNAAGTDIGYLRGKVASPASVGMTGQWCNLSNTECHFTYGSNNEGGSYMDGNLMKFTANIGLSMGANPGGTLHWIVECSWTNCDTDSCRVTVSYALNDWSDQIPTNGFTTLGTSKGSHCRCWTKFLTTDNVVSGASFSRAMSFYISVSGGCSGYYNNAQIRLRQWCYNEAGSSPVYQYGINGDTKGGRVTMLSQQSVNDRGDCA